MKRSGKIGKTHTGPPDGQNNRRVQQARAPHCSAPGGVRGSDPERAPADTARSFADISHAGRGCRGTGPPVPTSSPPKGPPLATTAPRTGARLAAHHPPQNRAPRAVPRRCRRSAGRHPARGNSGSPRKAPASPAEVPHPGPLPALLRCERRDTAGPPVAYRLCRVQALSSAADRVILAPGADPDHDPPEQTVRARGELQILLRKFTPAQRNASPSAKDDKLIKTEEFLTFKLLLP